MKVEVATGEAVELEVGEKERKEKIEREEGKDEKIRIMDEP